MTVVSVKPANKRKVNVWSDFDRVFDEFFRAGTPDTYRNGGTLRKTPAVNVVENGDAYRVELAAPGLEKEDFHVDVDKDVLNIEVAKEFQAEEGESYKRREFGYYEFKRSFRLPDTIDSTGIEANYNNGILNIVLPKKEEAKEKPARKIEIE